jgi:hypothetical protein
LEDEALRLSPPNFSKENRIAAIHSPRELRRVEIEIQIAPVIKHSPRIFWTDGQELAFKAGCLTPMPREGSKDGIRI